MPIKEVKFAFLGAGNIAKAIIGGLVSKKLIANENIYVFDTDASKYECDIMRSVICCDTMGEAVSSADVVVFALKPSVISGVAKDISASVVNFRKKTYLSVAAAVSTDIICGAMNCEVPIIRAMPNTPLLMGEGAVAVSRNQFVDDKLFSYICRLFSGISVISVIDEDMMNGIVSVNGSSPAYVYLFYKSMLSGAEAQGIPSDKAAPLILQSIRGALAMIERSGKDIDTLINDVSSPGGTTVAALSVFKNEGFAETVSKAMDACTNRAVEMAEEIKNAQ